MKGRLDRPALAMLAVVAAGALFLVACGGDDKDDASNNGAGSRSALPTASATTDASRALLDSLGAPAGATLVREYLTREGHLGREYAMVTPVEEAVNVATLHYREKLKAQGWETLQEHAATSAYTKGSLVFEILRYGPPPVQPDPAQRNLLSNPAPANTKFMFAVEAGLKP